MAKTKTAEIYDSLVRSVDKQTGEKKRKRKFRFRLKAANGKILTGSSAPYNNKKDVETALGNYFPDFIIVDKTIP